MPREDLPLLKLPEHERQIVDYIRSRPEGVYSIELTRVRRGRTLNQNAYYWAVVLPCVARGFAAAYGEADVSVDRAHRRLKDEFLRRPDRRADTGEVVGWFTPSSADLDVEEFCTFLDNVIAFARDQMMIQIPPPDVYRMQGQPKPRKQPERKTA